MWPIQFAFRLVISCRIFLCSLTLSNTSSFLTWSVQMIFSILLQHHTSKLSRCFWSYRIYILKNFISPKAFTTVLFFDSSFIHLRFVVNNLTLGQVLLRIPSCLLVTIIPPKTHAHIHLVFWVLYGSRNQNWNYYLLTPWNRVLLEKLTSKLCR